MNLSSFVVSLSLLLLSHSVQAQFMWDRQSATDKEKVGYTCSAHLMVMTMGDAGENVDELQLSATVGGMILSQLAAQETMTRTGKGMTNGNALSIRDQEIDVLMASLKTEPENTVKESHYCLAWASDIQKAITTKPNITLDQIVILDADSIAKPTSSQTSYVNSAYENMKKSGYVNHSEMKEALRKQLQ